MELVDGKPLNELITRKGMRLTEALRVAAQVADALAAAHAAGIVHRDLKPANIMVDAHGRVRVLDFGLAKLTASATAAAVGVDESTRTVTVNDPLTEEGAIVGSVPYMSPEQAEGRVVDARSDIFSFGAVLYEMITGQRAFRAESRISTLAAIVQKDPPPPGTISSAVPHELERLILRCLRKDINRRSQHMSDVRLALEELRDESESGTLGRPAAGAPAKRRLWWWPAMAIAALLVTTAGIWWIYNLRGTQPKVPDRVRISPDDGYSYSQPAISPDGGFVAYVSDRSSSDQLWLQQVGGGEPIQLTHGSESVLSSSFFPDGKRILYITTSADGKRSSLEVISALGGDPQALIQAKKIANVAPMLAPNGRQIAFIGDCGEGPGLCLMISSTNGGQPRELPEWRRMFEAYWSDIAVWTPDSRYVLCPIYQKSQATNTDEVEWFAFPVDGGKPVNTGAGSVLRAAGLGLSMPAVMKSQRCLFWSAQGKNVWEIRLSPGSWQVEGVPHQLTSGTLSERPASISSAGTVAIEAGNRFSDLYLIPVSVSTGQPTGPAQKLTKDLRYKDLVYLGGDPHSVYFRLPENVATSYYALNLDSGKQSLLANGIASPWLVVSSDGRQIAYNIPDGDSYSIRLGRVGTGEEEARVLCKRCGRAYRFSPDGRFLFYSPEATVKASKRKRTLRLLELASGQDRPWVEHPTDSVRVSDTVGQDSGWVLVQLSPPGTEKSERNYLVPWSEEPVPQSVWTNTGNEDAKVFWKGAPGLNFLYRFEGSKLLAARIGVKGISEPGDVVLRPGSPVTFKPDDDWVVRGPGLVFSRERLVSSVWLMELPH
jgi:eukaryotic-like serine/threonine-protein kinase